VFKDCTQFLQDWDTEIKAGLSEGWVGGAHTYLCVNLVHIAPYSVTEELFQCAQKSMVRGGTLMLYGPFREEGAGPDGADMVESNARFDASLKGRNQSWGIRSINEIQSTAAEFGFYMEEGEGEECKDRRVQMPSNNLFLTFTNKG